MYLDQLLQRQNNNLDLVRLVAACMVIYGHAHAVLPIGVNSDFVARWLQFDYSGSLAVKVFFFLSGLVVTNSLLQKKCLTQFILARIFRIWPALLVVVTACAFVVGPLVSNLPWESYFAHPQTSSYVRENLLMRLQYELPGVFASQASQAVNGSLWSIPYEVDAYIVLAALFALGLHRYKWLATAVVCLIILDPVTGNQLLFTWRPQSLSIDALAPCFAFGALLALWRDKIHISMAPALGALVLFLTLRQHSHAYYLFYVALFLGLLYVCSLPAIVALRLPADVSYGVYLWGWPMQQLLALYFPELGLSFNKYMAMLLATMLGTLSWYLVEKPCIRLGQRLLPLLQQTLRPLTRRTASAASAAPPTPPAHSG
ncbi:hypothetical protein B2J89_18415 [Acidovorax sp. SRB_24]|nr:hypothetical protein [Acidovorax sp. SRB_24]